MNIDWIHFTPGSALAGGLIIGAAAAAFILLNGRVAGISGILGGLLRPAPGDIGWRLAFLLGLAGAPLAYALVATPLAATVAADELTLAAAGLLVGLGTRYGAGCTSGHGVCGLSRRSPRSLAATAVFMLAGSATVFIVRHLLN